MFSGVDISEDILSQFPCEVLKLLLKDHTRSNEGSPQNIFWATSDYEALGEGYQYDDPILPQLITGEHRGVIMPRVLKSRNSQSARAKEMAEVFTPSWICNMQNNLVDEAWFGRKDVFNTEKTSEMGEHQWITTTEPIAFPKDKIWQDYVHDNRLEISCGEAPYIVSRYDVVTGEFIPLEQRIGLLDRKLRVVGENTDTPQHWFEWAREAYKSIYAYEWQGDNLLLARESMLVSFVEYYEHMFGKPPSIEAISAIANIIAWNVWQMDGIKGVIPNSCKEVRQSVSNQEQVGLGCDLPEEADEKAEAEEEVITQCEGCLKNDIYKHNGIYCLIKDWQEEDPKTRKQGHVIRFVDLIKASLHSQQEAQTPHDAPVGEEQDATVFKCAATVAKAAQAAKAPLLSGLEELENEM